MKSTNNVVEILQACSCQNEGTNFTYRYLNNLLPECCNFRTTFSNRLHFKFMLELLSDLPVHNLYTVEKMNSYTISFEYYSKDITLHYE